jgi:hypothetical protein
MRFGPAVKKFWKENEPAVLLSSVVFSVDGAQVRLVEPERREAVAETADARRSSTAVPAIGKHGIAATEARHQRVAEHVGVVQGRTSSLRAGFDTYASA